MSTHSKWGEVDYLVVGDSPGGLWLLSRLRGWVGSDIRMGLLTGQSRKSPLAVHRAMVRAFELREISRINSELLWPSDGMPWNGGSVAKRYPKIPWEQLNSIEGPLALSEREWGRRGVLPRTQRLLKGVLADYPELLGAAAGYWRLFGRAESLSPEASLWNLFHCLEIHRWNPLGEVPNEVERFSCGSLAAELTEIRLASDGSWEFSIEGKGTVVAKNVILSLSYLEVKALQPVLGKANLAFLPKIHRSADYPFRIELKRGAIPEPMGDLTLLFDSWEIPEPETEIWPIERQLSPSNEGCDSLTVWLSSHSDPALDSLSSCFREAVKRVGDLLPFSGPSIVNFSPGLQWQECIDDNGRRDGVARMEIERRERYLLSLMEPRTRYKNLFFVGPYFFTQWPYPMGELWAAQSIQPYLVAKKQKPPPAKQPMVTSPS